MTDEELEEAFKQLDLLFPTEAQRDYSNMPRSVRKDVCPKCGSEGNWVQMALVCSKHGPFLGHIK